jgi:hypothetical protein
MNSALDEFGFDLHIKLRVLNTPFQQRAAPVVRTQTQSDFGFYHDPALLKFEPGCQRSLVQTSLQLDPYIVSVRGAG